MADNTNVKPKITLYVDVVSPFAYLGYYMLRVSKFFAFFSFFFSPFIPSGASSHTAYMTESSCLVTRHTYAHPVSKQPWKNLTLSEF